MNLKRMTFWWGQFWRTVLSLPVAALLLAGCASDAERHAFDDWIRVDSERHGRDGLRKEVEDAHDPPAASPGTLQADATLEDYLRYAALNNPGLEAAFNEWKAALERIPQARTLPDPRFTYRYFIENVETRVGAQRQALGLSQMFPWFGKLELSGDMAVEAARAAQARYESRKLRLFYEVKRAFYEYYYLARIIEVVEENRNLMVYLEGVARTRFKTAAAQHPDVIRAQVELGKLDDQLKSQQALRGSLAARLNAALGRAIDTPIPWPTAIPEAIGSMDDLELERSLGLNNPELKALQHEIARHRKGIALAKKTSSPDVTLSLDYIDTAGRIDARPPDNGQDPIAAGVSINLPIWHEKYDAAVRESFAQFGAATKNRVDRQNVLAADLKTAIYHYEDAVRKIDLFRDTLVPKARQGLKATEASFRAGRSTFIDLVDAERVLLQFQLSYERALTDGATRLAEIEMLVGQRVQPVAAAVVPDDSQDQPETDAANPQDEGNNDGR